MENENTNLPVEENKQPHEEANIPKKKHKGTIIAAIVGLVAIVGGATYFGGGQLFQGFLGPAVTTNISPTTTPAITTIKESSISGSVAQSIDMAPAAPNIPFSVICSADKSTVNTGKNVTWEATVIGSEAGDSLSYQWSGSVGDSQHLIPGDLFFGEPLTEKQFDTYYNNTGTYTVNINVSTPSTQIKVDINTTLTIPGKTAQGVCSVQVKKENIFGSSVDLGGGTLNLPSNPNPICTVNNTSIKEGESATFTVKMNNAEDSTAQYKWYGSQGSPLFGINTYKLGETQKTVTFPTKGEYTIYSTARNGSTLTSYGTAECPKITIAQADPASPTDPVTPVDPSNPNDPVTPPADPSTSNQNNGSGTSSNTNNNNGSGSSNSTSTTTNNTTTIIYAEAESCANFPDISANDPDCKAIEYVKEIGAMTGTGNGYFDPSSKLQRDQIAKIMLESFDLFSESTDYCKGSRAFPDAGPSTWAFEYLCRAKNLDIVTGYKAGPDAGYYLPANLVNRAEFLAIILRNLNESMPKSGSSYNDTESSQWFSDYARYSYKNTLFDGSNLRPTDSVSRREVAQILYKLNTLGKI